MESWFLDVQQWVADLNDCPEMAIFEKKLSAPDLNCMGYSLAAGKAVQPGEIALRRQIRLARSNNEDTSVLKDSFNTHLHFRNLSNRSAFEYDIRESLTRDGLTEVTDPENLLVEGHYPVALFFIQEPGTSEHLDFHFVRLNSDGLWSWVPGQGLSIETQATDPETLDDSKVKNPFNMRWSPKQIPNSVWLVPKGGYETLLMQDIQMPALTKNQDVNEPSA